MKTQKRTALPKLRYYLEIYEPGSWRDVWMAFDASTPFMAFRVGDIVNPGIWPGSRSPMKVLRVTRVEHIIWDTSRYPMDTGLPPPAKPPVFQPAHKVCVYTEECRPDAPDRPASFPVLLDPEKPEGQPT